jgi:hypothetical protein
MLQSVNYSNVIKTINDVNANVDWTGAKVVNAVIALENSLNYNLVPHRRFNLNTAKEIVKAAVIDSPFRKEGVAYKYENLDLLVARIQIMLYFGWTAASCKFCNLQLFSEIRNLQK